MRAHLMDSNIISHNTKLPPNDKQRKGLDVERRNRLWLLTQLDSDRNLDPRKTKLQ